MKKKLFALIVISIAASMPAMAEGEYDDHIKARQGYFQAVKLNVDLLSSMVKGKTSYDSTKASIAADNIYQLSRLNTQIMWPKGSGNDSENTKAQPDIWEDFSAFEEKFNAWRKASQQLTATAGESLSVLKTNFSELSHSCKSCHREFKAR